MLLEVAAEDPEALREAETLTGRPGAPLRRAASFFVEQVLLTRGSDSYRVLGCSSDANAAELRRHMALILKWLHPDRVQVSAGTQHFDRSAFAALVTRAWENLKNGERRAAYDANRKTEATEPRKGTAAGSSVSIPRRLALYRIEREPFWTRLLVYLGRFR